MGDKDDSKEDKDASKNIPRLRHYGGAAILHSSNRGRENHQHLQRRSNWEGHNRNTVEKWRGNANSSSKVYKKDDNLHSYVRGRPQNNSFPSHIKDRQQNNHFLSHVRDRPQNNFSSNLKGQPPKSSSTVAYVVSSHQNPVDKNRTHGMNFGRLLQISKMDPNHILLKLSEYSNNFQSLLDEKLHPNFIVVMVKCLSKLCQLCFDNSKKSILTKTINSNFSKTLLQYMLSLPYISQEMKKENSLFWDDTKGFLSDVLDLTESMYDLTSLEVDARVFIDVVDLCMKGLQKYHAKSEKDVCDKFQSSLSILRETYKEVNTQLSANDFRKIEVIPRREELVRRGFVSIQPIIVNGAYPSVEHYLDVQFRLMREDFVCPLREGIVNYMEDPTSRKYNNIRFYRNAKFLKYSFSRDNVGVLVNFDGKLTRNKIYNLQTNKSERKMYNSKRFLYGSLLCFTDDNFKNIIFSTIVNRDNIDAGVVTIAMDGFYVTEDMFNKTYLMVESEIYFLPYRHVLETLKDRSLQKNFPMKKYIIDVEPCEVIPGCLSELPFLSRNLIYSVNYESHNDSHSDSEENVGKIRVLDHDNWPSASDLGLDDSQCEAFKMALTRQFVTIQGPPGTGKTFLALKVAETLLQNDCCASESPMLIVCYTNHALDQFLEGILKAIDSGRIPRLNYLDSSNLVRIGGQSKSDVLNPYKLSNLRRNSNSFNVRRDLIGLSDDLNNLQSTIDFINANEGILNVAEFSECLNFDITKFLVKFIHDGQRLPIVSWLLMCDGRIDFDYTLVNTADDKSESQANDYDESDFVHRPVVDADEDLFVSKNLKKFFHIESIAHNLEACRKTYYTLMHDVNVPADILQNQFFWVNKFENELKLTKFQLARGGEQSITSISTPDRPANFYSCDERWMFYWQWINALKKPLNSALMKKMAEFQQAKVVCDELLMVADYDILRRANVIGITTTGAAQQQSLLKALKSRIVIVEEAAEVMESHIIASLTSSCEHLILIGDHLQLKPMTATYRLAKHFNLDLSLFERMVKNGSHCHQLNVQHRMRPEFAKLITPTIYSHLLNDPSVDEYAPISGTVKSLYFIDHQFPETSGDEMSSRLNTHECDFLLCLARYFIHHQYLPADITILVTYTGQMFHMRREKKYYPELDSVRIINVDNFQGEESKIVLLSLVRSNEDAKIGFLSTPNRVCVALSRAKEGFFIVGNMSNLTQSSEIWKKINETLIEQESIGPSLTLQCLNHSEVFTHVKNKCDFDLVPNGGCNKDCNTLLECGHYCNMKCHIFDVDHSQYKCKKKCEKTCSMDHGCLLLCSEECKPCSVLVEKTLPCGHTAKIECHKDPTKAKCLVRVDVTLPLCKHEVSKSCYMDLSEVPCQTKCIDRLECGHVCTRNCHKTDDPDHEKFICHMPCTQNNKLCTTDHLCPKECHEECNVCTILVSKKRDKCPHHDKVACSVDVNETRCERKCTRSMECTHFCKQLCYQPCNKCDVVVKKPRSCGHTVSTKCSENADLVFCESKCKRLLECGHPCNRMCSAECDITICQHPVENPLKSLCGHKFFIPCNRSRMSDDKTSFLLMRFCKEECGQVLKGCEHRCKGTCGQCAGGRLHTPCQEDCGHILVCGHSCKQPCRESCPPCKMMCEMKCKHSKCPLVCGQRCRPCKMKCERSCAHGKCSKLCGDPCDWQPCSEPCQQMLKCNHPCRGLCGEECPPICKICDPESVPEILFGNEDDDDARFVKLLDCPHSVELNGLDTWVLDVTQNESHKISIRPCPYCNTPIVNTPRYLDIVRKSFLQIGKVKAQTFGNIKTIDTKLNALKNKIQGLLGHNAAMEKVIKWKKLILDIKNEVDRSLPKNSRKNKKNKREIQISLQDVEKYSNIINILEMIATLCVKTREEVLVSDVVMFQINNLITCVQKTGTNISLQQSEDLENELLRTERIIQFISVETILKAQSNEEKEEDIKWSLTLINDALFSTQIYTDVMDSSVHEQFEKLKGCINLPLTAVEKKTIVTAMGLKQGHWYACPNGHVYCIGDCGGATVEAVCPECKAKIGGTQHTLLADNRVATEMDGAKHSAWSEAAHLNNYDLRNL